MSRILVVDAEEELRTSVERALRLEGHDVDTASTAAEALSQLGRVRYELVISDLTLPDRGGLDLMRDARTLQPDVEVILATACADILLAVHATKQGAYAVLGKPFRHVELEHAVARALEKQALAVENQRLRTELAGLGAPHSTATIEPSAASPGSDDTPAITVPVGTPLEEVEQLLIKETLRTTGGNKQKAADLLGIAARTIYRKLGG